MIAIDPIEERKPTLMLVSALAFYPMHWQAFATLCATHQLGGAVLSVAHEELPEVHRQLGWVPPEQATLQPFAPDIRIIPPTEASRQRRWVADQVRSIRPDYVWIQEEPTSSLTFDTLRVLRHLPQSRVVCAVCENVFPSWRYRLRPWLIHRWKRLDGLISVADFSTQGIRAAGMPHSVPAWSLVGGGLSPPTQIEPMPLPFPPVPDDFIVGLVARIVEQKGWRYLLDAIASLPPRVKCIVIGSGEEESALHARIDRQDLAGRVAFLGTMPKEKLWSAYAAMDCLVLPSIDVPWWKEQFGGVLVDAMAMGLPVIGTQSGGIPQVIGPAGLVVPARNSEALAQAIMRLLADPELRERFGRIGRQRFCNEFSIDAYAGKIARALGLPASANGVSS